MVEDCLDSRRCVFCNSSFSIEILNKIEDDKYDVYCENCGDLIRRVNTRFNSAPLDIAEKESRTNVKVKSVKLRKEPKPNPDALHYPIGRVFYDTDFPITFKSNFIIVLSRIICYSALRLDQAGVIDLKDSEPHENVINDIYMATRSIQSKRIKPKFLSNLRESTTEEFERNLKKLQAKIKSNRQFREDFHVYTRHFIRRVFCIIAENKPDDQLTQFEKIILKDLHLLNIDDLKLPSRPKETMYENYVELEHTKEELEFDMTLGPLKTSITYEDYLALIEMRNDITVGMTRVEFYTVLVRPKNISQCEINLKWRCTKKKHTWQANYQKVRNGDGCSRCSKSSKLNVYSTKDLIEDLRNELQQFSEELALIFPERLVTKNRNKFSHQTLSKLWGRNEKYVSSYVIKRTSEDPNFAIKEKDLKLLKEKIVKKLGKKAGSCLEIIKKYQNNELNALQFIDRLEKELGRVSGELKITDEELGIILTDTHGFIKNVFTRIMYSSHHSYNPHYKFSKERLSEIREFLNEIFGNKAKKCLELLKKYEKLNPDLKEYSLQQYTITRPNYFHDIEKFPEKSYWFGFLSADATRAEKNGRITIELALKDKYLLEKFAKAVGLPIDRIKFRLIYRRYKGELKEYKTAILRFACKPLGIDLDKLGFRSTKNELNSLPNYVVQCLSKAKKKSKQEKIEWWQTLSGKVALGYLLGFYDGDGTYKGGKSAGIYAKNKTYLNHIKELFKIKNKIITTKVPGEIGLVFDQECTLKGCYRISLGPKLFEIMMKSYDGSLKRKRL